MDSNHNGEAQAQRTAEVLRHLLFGGYDGQFYRLADLTAATGQSRTYWGQVLRGRLKHLRGDKVDALARFIGLDAVELGAVLTDHTRPLPVKVLPRSSTIRLDADQLHELANLVAERLAHLLDQREEAAR